MKIKNITIQGFRGFNKVRTIDFHDRLTLIYAPNSYGKTSISEAFEWLLYGKTSKVEKADSKEEYKGSYRNCHLTDSLTPFVKATFVDDNGNETLFHGVLTEDEIIQRFINRQEVESWPLPQDISKVPRPFILQHALKYLLSPCRPILFSYN
jgi:AAA15 family ATPase/GTPase